METESVYETLAFNRILTRLIARENVIAFIRRESFKSHIFVRLSGFWKLDKFCFELLAKLDVGLNKSEPKNSRPIWC
jgi:hypothetical protein